MTEDAQRIGRRVGWSSLALWAAVGVALEAAHGFKLAGYLDDALCRELCTLAHAHGVGLALVTLVVTELGLPRLAETRARPVAIATSLAAALIPAGFLLSAIAHPEGDPGLPIVLVPLGALALLFALGTLAHAAWRRD